MAMVTFMGTQVTFMGTQVTFMGTQVMVMAIVVVMVIRSIDINSRMMPGIVADTCDLNNIHVFSEVSLTHVQVHAQSTSATATATAHTTFLY
jgi:hypothetical protein